MPPNGIVSDKMAPHHPTLQLLAHTPHLAHDTRKEVA